MQATKFAQTIIAGAAENILKETQETAFFSFMRIKKDAVRAYTVGNAIKISYLQKTLTLKSDIVSKGCPKGVLLIRVANVPSYYL